MTWMCLGSLFVTVLGLLVWWVGRVTWELAAGAMHVSGFMVFYDPGDVCKVLAAGALCVMSGAAFIGLRLLESMIPWINRSFFLRLAQSSFGWLALSVFGVLALRAAILHFEGWKLSSYSHHWGGPFTPALHLLVYWAVSFRVPLTASLIAAMIALRIFSRRGSAPDPRVIRPVEE